MTLTFELGLYSVIMNQCVKYIGQRSRNSEVIIRTDTFTHTHTATDCSSWTTKVVINNEDVTLTPHPNFIL